MLGLHPSERWNTHTAARGTHTRTRAQPLTRTHTGAPARTDTCPVKHADSCAQDYGEEEGDSTDNEFSKPEEQVSERGS